MPIRSLLYPGSQTKTYAALMGWFGKSSHISVGYRSDDATQITRQVQDMASRGFDGAVLAWYGEASFENAAAKHLRAAAEAQPGFKFVIMIDHGALVWFSGGLSATDAIIKHLNYIAANYYSSPAYLRVEGRPVVLEFALELHAIDWARVRSSVQGNPMIIFRNPNGWTKPFSDGAYAWGPADSIAYLDYFNKEAQQYTDQQNFGGSHPGFDDSLASWSEQRFVDERCGQTWLETFANNNKWYSLGNQLDFLQVATWNDYEEGSTIESGLDNCLDVQASVSGSRLQWSLSGAGQENTVHHYTVFISTDGQNLMPVVDLPRAARELDLAPYHLEPGTYSLRVKAVGQPSILNQMSNAVALTVTASSGGGMATPTFALAASTTTVTVDSGKTAQTQVSVSPANGFAGAVNLGCSSLPAAASCSFSPTMAQVSSAAVPVTVNISTGGTRAAISSPRVIYAGLPLLALLLPFTFRRLRRRATLVGMALVITMTMAACGGGSELTSTTDTNSQAATTPPGTYAIVVTAKSGSVQQQLPITVTVR